jgi:hypothetical protein
LIIIVSFIYSKYKKKSSTGEGAAGGERRIWERMEKWKDRKIGNSDFIDSVGDNL